MFMKKMLNHPLMIKFQRKYIYKSLYIIIISFHNIPETVCRLVSTCRIYSLTN